jgi:hypothetical protein
MERLNSVRFRLFCVDVREWNASTFAEKRQGSESELGFRKANVHRQGAWILLRLLCFKGRLSKCIYRFLGVVYMNVYFSAC